MAATTTQTRTVVATITTVKEDLVTLVVNDAATTSVATCLAPGCDMASQFLTKVVDFR